MRFNKVVKSYIESRVGLDSPKQITKDLKQNVNGDIELEDVEKYIAKVQAKSVPATPVEPPATPPTPENVKVFVPNVQKLMITKTSEQKRSGVAIMTQQASELADEMGKQQRGSTKTRYDNRTIFVIDPNKKD